MLFYVPVLIPPLTWFLHLAKRQPTTFRDRYFPFLWSQWKIVEIRETENSKFSAYGEGKDFIKNGLFERDHQTTNGMHEILLRFCGWYTFCALTISLKTTSIGMLFIDVLMLEKNTMTYWQTATKEYYRLWIVEFDWQRYSSLLQI